MVTLAERLEADYKTAMKAQDRLRIETIRLIKAAMQHSAIDKRKAILDDPEIIQILAQQVKQRRETIEAAQRTNRQDIVEQATRELSLITSYLPQPLSINALKQLIEEAITVVGSNQGQIMKQVMTKAAGSADGKLVSQLLSERLKQGASA